ncbi:HIT domain-containing protein [Thalassospira sp.]|uniref:HIT domain-containing protein n=1 Tax=Thalassospira sp. TaxID=1912094 RepID=UPI0027365B10|nr:HIT domain-containing protein [Thalassospira sp.]MDP2698698.1 HIT domain-containing protein [Thalassospira sp.]
MRRADTGSKFSWLFMSADKQHKPSYDIVLSETDNFVVLPSLGSLVDGWILIVPKRPMPNLAGLTEGERRELVTLRQNLTKRLELFSESVFSFEHGGRYGSVVSCSVDQAHLHLVPLPFDLIATSISETGVDWQQIPEAYKLDETITSGREYLYLANYDTEFVGFPEKNTSQWFRKIIARNLGCANRWDYKKFPSLDRLHKTAKAFGQ